MRKARSAKARSKAVDVGFFSTARYPDGTPVAAVAAWNEFGTPTIPERAFFRGALHGSERAISPILRAGIDPKDMALDDRTAGLIGEVMKARIQSSIVALRDPPNAPATIARKGSSSPLVDTGVLHGSVDYRVTGAGDVEE